MNDDVIVAEEDFTNRARFRQKKDARRAVAGAQVFVYKCVRRISCSVLSVFTRHRSYSEPLSESLAMVCCKARLM